MGTARPVCVAALTAVVLTGVPAIALSIAALQASVTPSPPQSRVVVYSTAEATTALRRAVPGTAVVLAPGVYPGGIFASGIAGTADAPIVLEAADPMRPPVIRGGGFAIQLSGVRYVTLRHLIIERQRNNGINIDDGDRADAPSQHVTLSDLTVRNIDNRGIAAGIKLSGVQDFVIERSTIGDWGGGSAITAIGAHRGVIAGNVFRHRDDTGATGPHIKGGSTDIVIRDNRFEHAGLRAVQIGGATSPQFFRPQPPSPWEASNILVEHNVFVGSEATVAFVNVDGSTFRHNTVYRPRKWLVRILQEVRAPGFVPSRRGVVADNVIYFHGDDFPAGPVNVGDGTDAPSFEFTRNWWYRADRPAESRQVLPSVETNAVYGIDPLFAAPTVGDFRRAPGSPAAGYGAELSEPTERLFRGLPLP